jgi:hypothetical protein
MDAELEKAFAGLKLGDIQSADAIERQPAPSVSEESSQNKAESGNDDADQEEHEREEVRVKERDEVIMV